MVCGDLAQPFFGLPQDTYNTLVAQTTDIYHNGTRVNMTLPYAALKTSNVGGTVNVIRMAVASNASVNYVSSASVLQEGAREEDWIKFTTLHFQRAHDGYTHTKMVSERMLWQAWKSHNVRVRVIRPAAICGHTVTGFSNTLDFTNLLVRACVRVKAAVTETRMRLHWASVDFVAHEIVRIGMDHNTVGKVFHIIGDGMYIHFPHVT